MILDVVYEIEFSCQKDRMWQSPIPFKLVLTDDPMSFLVMPEGTTGLPLPPHPGAWGFQRAYHIHEGVDLYVPHMTQVTAAEPGEVVAIMPFTGEQAGSSWWHKTWAVMVEGPSGVVNYGEIVPDPALEVGDKIEAGANVGKVLTVLKKDKGRPMSMLHLELYARGAREPVEWKLEDRALLAPDGLLNPTFHLMDLIQP